MAENLVEILIRARDEATGVMNRAIGEVRSAGQTVTVQNQRMEQGIRLAGRELSSFRSVARFAAAEVVSELNPALGTSVARFTSLASVASATGGTLASVFATIGVGAAITALGLLVASLREAKKAQEDFEKAVREGNTKAQQERLRTLDKEIKSLQDQITARRGLTQSEIDYFDALSGTSSGLEGVDTLERRVAEAQKRRAEIAGELRQALVNVNAEDITRLHLVRDMAVAEALLGAQELAVANAQEELSDITAKLRIELELLEAAIQDTDLDFLEVEAEAVAKAFQQAAADTFRFKNEIQDLERVAAERAEESAIATIRRASEARVQPIRDVFEAVDRAITGTISGLLQGTQTVEEAMRRMAQNIAISLVENIVRRGLQQVQDALIDTFLMGRSAGGGGGILGSIIGGIGSIFGGFFGGPAVDPNLASGAAYVQHGGILTRPTLMVGGEAGPEAVIPLDRLGDFAPGEGREPVVVHQVFHVSPGLPEAIRRELWAMLPQFKKEAIAGVLEASDRGGAMARAMGRRGGR
jgi:hypothetical protein